MPRRFYITSPIASGSVLFWVGRLVNGYTVTDPNAPADRRVVGTTPWRGAYPVDLCDSCASPFTSPGCSCKIRPSRSRVLDHAVTDTYDRALSPANAERALLLRAAITGWIPGSTAFADMLQNLAGPPPTPDARPVLHLSPAPGAGGMIRFEVKYPGLRRIGFAGYFHDADLVLRLAGAAVQFCGFGNTPAQGSIEISGKIPAWADVATKAAERLSPVRIIADLAWSFQYGPTPVPTVELRTLLQRAILAFPAPNLDISVYRAISAFPDAATGDPDVCRVVAYRWRPYVFMPQVPDHWDTHPTEEPVVVRTDSARFDLGPIPPAEWLARLAEYDAAHPL